MGEFLQDSLLSPFRMSLSMSCSLIFVFCLVPSCYAAHRAHLHSGGHIRSRYSSVSPGLFPELLCCCSPCLRLIICPRRLWPTATHCAYVFLKSLLALSTIPHPWAWPFLRCYSSVLLAPVFFLWTLNTTISSCPCSSRQRHIRTHEKARLGNPYWPPSSLIYIQICASSCPSFPIPLDLNLTPYAVLKTLDVEVD